MKQKVTDKMDMVPKLKLENYVSSQCNNVGTARITKSYQGKKIV